MPKLVGGVAGIVALAAGIFGHVDALYCLERAAVALVVGWIVGSILQALVGAPVEYKVVKATDSGDSSDSTQQGQKAA